MLESHIKESDLLTYEPSLEDYRRLDELSMSGVIVSAKQRLNRIIAARGIDFRKLCNRLTLTEDTKSGKDIINRHRLVVNVTSGEGVLTLSGTNDATDESYTTVFDDFAIVEAGEHTRQIEGNYTYYKISQSGDLVFTSYLVETSFEDVHAMLALHMLFLRLVGIQGTDNFQERADWYWNLFQDTMSTLRYSLDTDLNGIVDKDDDTLSVNSISVNR